MWEKYRKESKQTICIIGVLTLAAKLCKADGHFSIEEEEEILSIIPHDKDQKRLLLRILDEALFAANLCAIAHLGAFATKPNLFCNLKSLTL